jgi:hypothetical protein
MTRGQLIRMFRELDEEEKEYAINQCKDCWGPYNCNRNPDSIRYLVSKGICPETHQDTSILKKELEQLVRFMAEDECFDDETKRYLEFVKKQHKFLMIEIREIMELMDTVEYFEAKLELNK